MVEWEKHGKLRWFGHVMRINENEFVKRLYTSHDEGQNARGKPPVEWRDND